MAVGAAGRTRSRPALGGGDRAGAPASRAAAEAAVQELLGWLTDPPDADPFALQANPNAFPCHDDIPFGEYTLKTLVRPGPAARQRVTEALLAKLEGASGWRAERLLWKLMVVAFHGDPQTPRPPFAGLDRLTQPEAAELLGVLARSRTDDDVDAGVLEPSHHDGPAAAAEPAVAAPAAEPVRVVEPADDPAGLSAEYGKAQALVTVRLLGVMQITTHAGELRSGLRASARELLAYYLIHPDGASLEQAVDAMWPDTELGRGRERFWTALGNLRSLLRKATGASELKAIERDGDRYRVDPTVFAVDLWRFQQALAAARHAQLDPAVAAALAQAGEAYGGVLLDGAPYAWVEVPREEVRRRAVDALARLAELHQAAGDQDGALSALEQAVAADPVAEELYRRVMRLEAELGRPDAVRRTYRLLARRLADLDVDPDPETEQLVAELLRRPGA